MSGLVATLKKIFQRKKPIPLACSMSLENDEGHVHTGACFVDIQPLTTVELFQSQGCQSCPPAIPAIHESIKNDPNLLLLTYNVTYFDHMGWTDTFGKRQWDQRQRAYVQKWGRNNIFTPQVIADGIADGTGAGQNEVNNIVSAARGVRSSMPWRIIVDTNDTELRIDSDLPHADPHDILLIMYDPKPETVKIKKAVNKGKKIEHRNVVTGISKIGEWVGGNLTMPLPDAAMRGGHGNLEIVAVVQAGNGGPILASQKL